MRETYAALLKRPISEENLRFLTSLSLIHSQEAAFGTDREVEGFAVFEGLDFERKNVPPRRKALINASDFAATSFFLDGFLNFGRNFSEENLYAFEFACRGDDDVAEFAAVINFGVVGGFVAFGEAEDVNEFAVANMFVDGFADWGGSFFEGDLDAGELAVECDGE